MRELTELELANVSFLTQNDVPFGLIEVTRTGLEKSILDATEEFREFLVANAIHDFAQQPQGQDHKRLLPAVLIGGQSVIQSQASLYRPETKKGDPRVWFRGLKAIIEPGGIFAAIWSGGRFSLVPAGSVDLPSAATISGPIADLLRPFVEAKSDTVSTLLGMMRSVAAKGFLPVPVRGTTAVGRLLETQLGIDINSRRDPDFRGIEIKSSRSDVNRTTLFAKTPDWHASKYKSSRELLDRFGYDRDGKRKLSCTISGIVANSQGLRLSVDESADLLHVNYVPEPAERAVQWELETLRHSLAVKHNETFWVKAETKQINGWEYIRFRSVRHTQRPIVAQLSSLLRDGKVTVDFLIREHGDKGYLFKLHPKNLGLLFPPARDYTLDAGDSIAGPPPEAAPVLF